MKKKTKVIAAAALTIAMSASLIAGGTYALFTSESTVNVAVTSGTVDVVATASEPEITSSLGTPLGETSATTDGNTVTLTNMVPGDTVTFTITVTNNSNVTVNYRTIIKNVEDDGLFKGLTVTFTEGENKQTFTGGYAYADWATFAPGTGDKEVTVAITLPEDAGNEYQGKSCKLAYTVEAVQGNAYVENPIDYNEEENVYYVNNEIGMMMMNGIIDSVAHSEDRRIQFVLTDDMDMTGYDWTPIAAHHVNVDGQYEGKNHTISNLNAGTDSTGKSGFIGYAGATTIKNLTLNNVTAKGAQAGVIAGNTGGSYFDNVTITGTNSVTYDYNANPSEDYGAVGAVVGVLTGDGINANTNIAIASGATVTVDYNGVVSKAAYYDNGYAQLNDISSYVVNEGTVTLTGDKYTYIADGLCQAPDGSYLITNENGLMTAGASYFAQGGTFKLGASLDITDMDWKPVTVGADFVFDGQENTITGLSINPAGSSNGMDALGFIESGKGNITVSNVTFDKAEIIGTNKGNSNAAVVIATTKQNADTAYTSLTNVNVTNSKIEKCDRTGGLISYCEDSAVITITNCNVDNNTFDSIGTTGALVAYGVCDTMTIKDFSATNNTISSSEGSGKAGIVIGTLAGVITVKEDDVTAAIAGSTATNAGVATNNFLGRSVSGSLTINDKAYESKTLTEDNGLSLTGGGYNDITLAAGEYTMPGVSSGTTVTISGTKDTEITVSGTVGLEGSDVTLNGVTVETNNGDYQGLNASNVTYNGVTFNGGMNCYGDKVVFNDCTFNLTTQYVWTYGAAEVEFNNCKFYTDGKAILLYNEGHIEKQTVTIKDCEFYATKSGYATSKIDNQACAAVELDNYNGIHYTLKFEGTNTFDDDFSGAWRIKNIKADSIITVDGVDYKAQTGNEVFLNGVEYVYDATTKDVTKK